MKKIFALFSLLASLLLLTACYAKKEEVDESIRTTKALFKKLPFQPVKVSSDGSYHYEGGGATIDLYFTEEDIQKYAILKYHPDRKGSKIEFYEIFYGERTADQLLDCLVDQEITSLIDEINGETEHDMTAEYQQKSEFDRAQFQTISVSSSKKVDDSDSLNKYLMLYSKFLVEFRKNPENHDKLKEIVRKMDKADLLKWSFEIHSDQVLDEKNISEDEAESRFYNSRSGDTEYYAPETINKYIDLGTFPKDASVKLYFKKYENVSGQVILKNQKD